MSIIPVQLMGDKAVINKSDLDQLAAWAKESHDFEFEIASDDFTRDDIIPLAKAGKAFDFWQEEGEDVYSLEDGEPV